jgi:prenylcysteine oxidase/farnesylcysteine lyase
VFEKSSRIGGRTLTVNAFDSPALPVELGASIFVNVNHIMYNATRDFNLSVNDLGATLAGGDITAIWDGKTFVYQSISGQSWWWDAAKMFWKYGTSPYYAIKIVNRVVGSFLKLYEKPYFPFRSLTQRVYELELASITSITGEQLLRQNKARLSPAPDFIMHCSNLVRPRSTLIFPEISYKLPRGSIMLPTWLISMAWRQW